MVYYLFQNLFGNGPKKDKMSDQNPGGAETKFPQYTHTLLYVVDNEMGLSKFRLALY